MPERLEKIAIPTPTRRHATALDYGLIEVEHGPHWDEPLVELRDYGIAGIPWYARTDGHNPPYFRPVPGAPSVLRARKSVAERLSHINQRLATAGLELYVYDAWRSLECQAGLWDHFLELVRGRAPEAGEAELQRMAGVYVSDPSQFEIDDSRTWPTHTTGGAVDLTLRRVAGQLLDMGCRFDEASPLAWTAAMEGGERDDFRQARRTLYWAMTQGGFVNYPFEWWHYDWGTQMSVLFDSENRGRTAVYGPVAA